MPRVRATDGLRRLVAPEHRVLVLSILVLAGIWLFALLTSEVLEGDSRAFDERVLRALRDPGSPDRLRGPEWTAEVARDLTALGSYTVLTLVLLAAAGFLILVAKPGTAAMVSVAGAGGIALNGGLKLLFGRPRPDVVPWLVEVGHASFPSGHAMLAAAVYLSLAVLIARVLRRRRLKTYVLAIAGMLVALVGISRVVLGVHYPTDVIAGWLAGGVWALLCGMTARMLQRRGALEPEEGGPSGG
jgi:undecaprenyl-diphosphatase